MLLQVGKLLLQAQARDMEPLQRDQRKPGSKQKQASLLQQQVGSVANSVVPLSCIIGLSGPHLCPCITLRLCQYQLPLQVWRTPFMLVQCAEVCALCLQGAQKAKPQVESQEPAAMTIQFEHNTRLESQLYEAKSNAAKHMESNTLVTHANLAMSLKCCCMCRDIRGMRADDVASILDEAIACNPSGSSIFIVHGMGTGRLRTEVHKALKQHSQIARFELEGNSGGGCTMAVIR